MLAEASIQFHVGDLVRFRSGSPSLKVVRIEGDNVTVEWRNEVDELTQVKYPAICFEKE